jgi:hypothetical protein
MMQKLRMNCGSMDFRVDCSAAGKSCDSARGGCLFQSIEFAIEMRRQGSKEASKQESRA